MKPGFTLIEILVSVTIVALISGGALVYLNNFNSRQKLDRSKEEVISAIKLAQSYAKTRQLPFGSAETELQYVQLQTVGNYLVAGANGIGSTYFSVLVNNEGMAIGSTPALVYFWAGDGRLSQDTVGTSYANDEKATFYIQAQNDIDDYGKLEINSLGQVNFVGYF